MPVRVRLEGNGARHDAAIELRQHDIHREVAGVQALAAGLPGLFRGAGQHDLQHRAVEGRKGIGGSARCHREACGIQDHVGLAAVQGFRNEGHAGCILQACDIDRLAADAARGKRIDQRVNGRCLRAFQDGTVEGDRRQGLICRRGVPIESGLRQQASPAPVLRVPRNDMRAIGKEAARIDLAARHQILAQPLAMPRLQRRARRECRIGGRIAGQDRKRDAAIARKCLDLFEPVAPVACAPQQAQHDELRRGQRPLDVEVDGKIVLQLQKIGQPQGQAPDTVLRAGQRGQFAVRRRQHDDVGRVLAEVDGFRRPVDDARCGGEEMHHRDRWACAAVIP